MTRKLLPLLLLALSAPAWGAYACSSPITVGHAMVSGSSDLSNFSVFIQLSGTSFKSVANGGCIQNAVTWPASYGVSVPADLVISTTNSLSSPSAIAAWDVISWDAVNGVINLKGLATTFSHSSDWTLYAIYGNASVTTYQGGAVGAAYDSNTVAVMHNASTTPFDSSANNNSLTNHGATAATGPMAGLPALNFASASSQYVANPSGSITIPSSSSMTVEAFIKPTTTSGSPPIATKWTGSTGTNEFTLDLNAGSVELYLYNGSGYINAVGSTSLNTGTWYSADATFDEGSNYLYVYLNGVQNASNSSAGFELISSNKEFDIGTRTAYDYFFNGIIWEVVLSKTNRSPDWLLTETRNILSYGTYVTVGSCTGSCTGGGAATVTMTPIIM